MNTASEIRSTVLWFIKALFVAQLVIVPKEYRDEQLYIPIWQPGIIRPGALLLQLVLTAAIGIAWLWLTRGSDRSDRDSGS